MKAKTSDAFDELADWYTGHCDDDWEHSYGVDIGTLDNPGWKVCVDLAKTELANQDFQEVKIERSPNDWLHCCVEGAQFRGYGGPGNLREIIGVFNDWARTLAERAAD